MSEIIKILPKDGLNLRKEFRVFYGVTVTTGLIIGGGIYISPQLVLKYAGSPSLTLTMWFLGEIFSLIGALCFAEIGVKYPKRGGPYTYLREFYGSYFGFVYLWQFVLLIMNGSNALKAILSARFLLKVLFPTCSIPMTASNCLASFITNEQYFIDKKSHFSSFFLINK